ncbi:hypothetical protein B0H16DRAFT_432668 [Mycena metata]|uniref:Uncharacterized protein n=1 Tax=Mycena metata TaxID=1033252 RepID=A0AAD7HD24_9AGAR|nr:hypothetical protein B0H16DRAFT_432668 [Mycena metata]
MVVVSTARSSPRSGRAAVLGAIASTTQCRGSTSGIERALQRRKCPALYLFFFVLSLLSSSGNALRFACPLTTSTNRRPAFLQCQKRSHGLTAMRVNLTYAISMTGTISTPLEACFTGSSRFRKTRVPRSNAMTITSGLGILDLQHTVKIPATGVG